MDIARRWGLPLESLISANNLRPPYTIFIGQQLAVPPGVNSVRVKPGDTVYKISQAFRIPTSIIIEANQLQPPYLIIEGQLLEVPPGVPYYVVQPGDTLYQLALRFNVITGGIPNTDLIRQVNNLPSNLLLPGMRLTIPYAPTGDEGLIAYTSGSTGHFDLWLFKPEKRTKPPIDERIRRFIITARMVSKQSIYCLYRDQSKRLYRSCPNRSHCR